MRKGRSLRVWHTQCLPLFGPRFCDGEALPPEPCKGNKMRIGERRSRLSLFGGAPFEEAGSGCAQRRSLILFGIRAPRLTATCASTLPQIRARMGRWYQNDRLLRPAERSVLKGRSKHGTTRNARPRRRAPAHIRATVRRRSAENRPGAGPNHIHSPATTIPVGAPGLSIRLGRKPWPCKTCAPATGRGLPSFGWLDLYQMADFVTACAGTSFGGLRLRKTIPFTGPRPP